MCYIHCNDILFSIFFQISTYWRIYNLKVNSALSLMSMDTMDTLFFADVCESLHSVQLR